MWRPAEEIAVPGRVNLIGEHIDYHNLPVLPIAIQKRVAITFTARPDGQVRISSDKASNHDWRKYVRAAVEALKKRQPLRNGIDGHVTSDLPMAAGLSSSSALLTAVTLALMRVNEIEMPLTELTDLLANGEQFVGTRGGAMDHVAILASRAGCATLINSFEPLEIDYIPVPARWRFLIAHSLVQAEKSGAARSEYNARREAASNALQRLGFGSYRDAVAEVGAQLKVEAERNAFLHVVSEAHRVREATAALCQAEAEKFGRILTQSHISLRDRLRVSLPVVDDLVDSALAAGALGARITGAGFGGCVVCLCTDQNVDQVRNHLHNTYYAHRPGFDPAQHLFVGVPSSGASSPQPLNDTDQN